MKSKLLHQLETACILQRDYPDKKAHVIAEWLLKLMRMAKRMEFLNLVHCNSGLSEYQETVQDKLTKRIEQHCVEFGVGVEVQHDPRGCAVRLKLPSGAANGFHCLWGLVV